MTGAIIITICTLLLIAYIFDLTSSKTKVPSVILLLLLGWLVQQGSLLFKINIPDLTALLPILGTVGLILIVLEGSLEFTLPDGAVICGYGLDLDGKLIDGVIVEKEKARQVFEESVRTGKSAGISEVVKGNIFKNRVYPIKPNSSRIVQVTYQSEAEFNENGDIIHRVPIRFNSQLKNLSLTIECTKSEETKVIPTVISDFSTQPPTHGNGLKFEEKGDRYIAKAIWSKGVTPDKNPDFFNFTVFFIKNWYSTISRTGIRSIRSNQMLFCDFLYASYPCKTKRR